MFDEWRERLRTLTGPLVGSRFVVWSKKSYSVLSHISTAAFIWTLVGTLVTALGSFAVTLLALVTLSSNEIEQAAAVAISVVIALFLASRVSRALFLRALVRRLRRAGVEELRRTDATVARVRNGVRPTVETGEPIDLSTLRAGGLASYIAKYVSLSSQAAQWAGTNKWRKRGPEVPRVLWLTTEDTPERSVAHLAALVAVKAAGRRVFDCRRDLGLLSTTINELCTAPPFGRPPVVAINLHADEAIDWPAVRHDLERLRHVPHHGADPFPRFVISGTRRQAEAAQAVCAGLLIIDPVDLRGNADQRLASYQTSEVQVPSELKYFNRGLPITTKELVGRAKQLGALDAAWASPTTKVISLIGYGGTGKSSIVNEWLARKAGAKFAGVSRVFLWSFYSQGTRENLVSADSFIRAAYEWLGKGGDVPPNAYARGETLAAALIEEPTLLVLDGLEPLQHPLDTTEVGGTLTDVSMDALLNGLARAQWTGLVVITSRVPITDLHNEDDAESYVELALDNLSDTEGAALLEQLGVDGSVEELTEASHNLQGHALSVTLLGTYLRQAHKGSIAGQVDLPALTRSVELGGHAYRMMEAYRRWLAQDKREIELRLIEVIGLFDRPADWSAIKKVFKSRSWKSAGANEFLVDSLYRTQALAALSEMGIAHEAGGEQIDAHPLIREFARDRLRDAEPLRWVEGNAALFRYYASRVQQEPETPDEMSSLYAAVTHGCAAGNYQNTFDHVLLPRIWRGRRKNYSTRHLKMIGADLAALSNFFEPGTWTSLKTTELSTAAQTLLLTNAGVRLRALGRLTDARRSFGAAIATASPESTDNEQLAEDASYAAAQNCELLVLAALLKPTTDDSQNARDSGVAAVTLADQGNDSYFQMHARSSLAEVYFMLGERTLAKRYFEDARAIDAQRQPKPRFLYSQSLFRWAYYLIDTDRPEDLLSGQSPTPDWGTNGADSSLLSSAIRSHALGAVTRAIGVATANWPALDEANAYMDEAVRLYKSAGYLDYVVRGLTERAVCRNARGADGDRDSALADLHEAERFARRGQMDLLIVDLLLVRAGIEIQALKSGGPGALQRLDQDLAEASRIVSASGYLRVASVLETANAARSDLPVLQPGGG